MTKLDEILLVDDYEPDNFLHRILIREADCARKVTVALNGQEALDYLTTEVEGRFPQPDLILLDLNMPVMNGWEFLGEYERLDAKHRARAVVVMLTTSLSRADSARAQGRAEISKFMNKPLTREMLEEILDEHFPDRNLPTST